MARKSVFDSPEYRAWAAIKTRCYNPRVPCFSYYGGRGITVCDRWRESFRDFYADMGPRPSGQHSIERRDFNGPYSPDNCYWATRMVQAANTRKNDYITFDGGTLHLYEWARRFGLEPRTLWARIYGHGWSIEKSFRTPVLAATDNKPHSVWITFDGQTRTISGWARTLGVEAPMIRRRLLAGWAVETALTKPSRKRRAT